MSWDSWASYTVSVERTMSLIWKELTLATDKGGGRKEVGRRVLWIGVGGCGGVWSSPFSLDKSRNSHQG